MQLTRDPDVPCSPRIRGELRAPEGRERDAAGGAECEVRFAFLLGGRRRRRLMGAVLGVRVGLTGGVEREVWVRGERHGHWLCWDGRGCFGRGRGCGGEEGWCWGLSALISHTCTRTHPFLVAFGISVLESLNHNVRDFERSVHDPVEHVAQGFPHCNDAPQVLAVQHQSARPSSFPSLATPPIPSAGFSSQSLEISDGTDGLRFCVASA